jgi:hypothetical protein
MNRPRLVRALRITWTAVWGIAAVLLVTMWVRSYWWAEEVTVPVPGGQSIGLSTAPGSMAVVINPSWGTPPWIVINTVVDEWIPTDYEHSRVGGYFGSHANWVRAPFWFSLLIVAMFATLPWLSWHFSIRTLLIATTLVAVALGLIAWLTR